MFKKEIFTKIKEKAILVLGIISILCIACFTLTACNDDDSSGTIKDPVYNYTETTDDGIIKNSSFDFETADLDSDDFPKTTVTGWSKSVDNSAKTSTINSGVVSVAENDWKGLATSLLKDDDYKSFLTDKKIIDSTKSDSENIDAIINNYLKNPGKKGSDNYIYMLNNLAASNEYGLGTAQKLSLSSSIKVSAGEIGKISIWIKTQNLVGQNDNYGANIRLINSFNGSSQGEFRINKIRCTDWTEYVIYVKGDKVYNSNLTLVVGLGYGNGKTTDASFYTEGTVYFDDITYTTVDSLDGITIDSTLTMNYGSKDNYVVNDKTSVLYDMSFDATEGFEDLTFGKDSSHLFFTKSNIIDKPENDTNPAEAITSKTIIPTSNVTYSFSTNTNSNEKLALALTDASYTVKIDNNGGNFKLGANQFAIVKFTLTNELSSFGATDIFVDVADINGDITKVRKSVTTIAKEDNKKEYTVTVKNTFESGEREFYINLVIGSNNISSVKYASELSSGNVIIEDLMWSTPKEIVEKDTDNPTIYDFYTSTTNVSLYAGYGSEQSSSSNTTSYPFEVAPGNIGSIINEATNTKEYIGVSSNHSYITDSASGNDDVNTRSGHGTPDGVAGLINTKYLKDNKYSYITGLAEALQKDGNWLFEEDIQPLMIYNKTSNHYGFIGNEISISSSVLASVSVTLRVTGNAKAYIYLVETSNQSKDVLTFDDFTTSTGAEIKGSELKFELNVDKNMMDEDGWTTVNFYLGAGQAGKKFRVEVWNGGRDGQTETASEGFVIIKEINVKNSAAFTEATRYEDTFSVAGNPLYDLKVTAFEKEDAKLYAHTRTLTDTEIEFNEEYPDKKVSYLPKYVWASNEKVIYAIFNTVDPSIVDPYDSLEDDETTTESGCTATADPSTFWLSFSSILLGTVLLLALIALIVKNYRRRRLANANDAKVHYQVKSRISYQKKETNKKEQAQNIAEEKETEESFEEVIEQPEEEKILEEETLDSYVYGEVQDFGSEETNNETSEESKDDN